MQFQKIFVPIASVVLVVVAYRAYGWGGVAIALGALVMWLLLHFTRMMQVLKRATDRPIGFVDSAVMLNAKLKPGVNLLHVVAMTRALGELVSPKDSQPELFRWTDASESFVTCEFRQGKLVTWELVRPAQPVDATTTTPPAPAP
ncbi:MAG: glycerate kinase [Burkholderiales bacterium]|nr:glycerate kinase [Burkholderiales bacterium]